jgi:sec-independent protein translocase protein TatC
MRGHRGGTKQPTMMIHHVREIQIRLLAVVGVLLVGMIVGYMFYEPLFEFIKAPLNAPLHYMSPAGSFTFIIKICLMVGTIVTLPVAIYNAIMFVQPALAKQLSKARIYFTTLASLVLAAGGAAFGFLIIIPLALRFFYKFQVDGLVAIISADEYLRFVVSVIITFVLIFQLPLIISLIDHITPLQPKKLLKIEKYIIVGSVFIGVVVPFALDPTVQLLIASPIIVLYNLSIVIVMLQHAFRRRYVKATAPTAQPVVSSDGGEEAPVAPKVAVGPSLASYTPQPKVAPVLRTTSIKSLDGTRPRFSPASASIAKKTVHTQLGRPQQRVISDIRPMRSQIVTPPRPVVLPPRQIAE